VNVVLVDEAQSELVAAIARYESIEIDLERKLRDEVTSSLAWIQAHPHIVRIRPRGYSRINLRTFPY